MKEIKKRVKDRLDELKNVYGYDIHQAVVEFILKLNFPKRPRITPLEMKNILVEYDKGNDCLDFDIALIKDDIKITMFKSINDNETEFNVTKEVMCEEINKFFNIYY